MLAILKIPEMLIEYQAIIAYLQSKVIPSYIQGFTAKYNFERRCKKFEVDSEVLYVPTVFKDGVNKYERHHIVPRYNTELHTLLLEHFHDNANHHNYHSTYSALSVKHISIVQSDVQKMHGIYEVPDINQSSEPILLDNANVNNENLKNNMKQHIEQISQVQQLVNDKLGKYREKLCLYRSVHQKKTKNNTIEPETTVVVVPNHDTNPQTRK
ncbi:9572_t:CDS:2 [Cetraspora pellucida]|uniref:9572_t:CDS:1 n=1 Tax=Cetraspora pellucida TaxID=1433469 RepID=A0ACA9NDJ1_9GLOM|nr:9572_t:CDS:2 [Cetraspora pellucida]